MLIKAGVDISRLNWEVRYVFNWVTEILEEHDDELVITSTYEGNHMESSYHYANDAFDFDARNCLKPVMADTLREDLPDYFDVVWEGDHIHVELDRRKFNEQKEK